MTKRPILIVDAAGKSKEEMKAAARQALQRFRKRRRSRSNRPDSLFVCAATALGPCVDWRQLSRNDSPPYRKPDRKQTDKRGFRTKRDAEQFAATVEVAKMRGEYVPPTLGRITMGQLGPSWLERQQGHMKPSGFRSYESAWRVHVEPRWGRTRVSEIQFTAVQAWVSQLAAKRGPVIVADRVLRAGTDIGRCGA
jgi:Arm DNA-binding domain